MNELNTVAANYVPLVMLLSLRVGVCLSAMPAPFGSLAPARIRAALTIWLAFLLASLSGAVAFIDASPLTLARAAFGEALIGAVIGLTVRVTLAAADVAGNLAGMSMGLGFAASVDPTFEESTNPVAQTLSVVAVLIFFGIRGHHQVVAALAATVRSAPPGEAFAVLERAGAIDLGGSIVAHGLRIAAPVVWTMFIVQLGAALVARAAPRVHLFALTFAIAVTAGLLLLFVSIPSIGYALGAHIDRVPATLRSLFGGP